MPPDSDTTAAIAAEWREYAREVERAAVAGTTASHYETLLSRPPESMRPFRQRMAILYRRTEARHRASARLHRLHALRLQRWNSDDARGARPVFMAAVASQLQVPSAAVTLFHDQQETLTAVSDDLARTAHDLEAVIGQGPAREVVGGGGVIVAAGGELIERWPHLGPALAESGVQSLVAVPLQAGSHRLGALCGYSPHPTLPRETVALADDIADTLAHTVLLDATDSRADGITPLGTLFDEADFQAAVNQAVGMVSAHSHCDLDTALTLLRARAFAENLPLAQVARRVLDGDFHIQ